MDTPAPAPAPAPCPCADPKSPPPPSGRTCRVRCCCCCCCPLRPAAVSPLATTRESPIRDLTSEPPVPPLEPNPVGLVPDVEVDGRSSNPALALEFRLIGSVTPNPCSFDDAEDAVRPPRARPPPPPPASGRSSWPRLSVRRDNRLREPPGEEEEACEWARRDARDCRTDSCRSCFHPPGLSGLPLR
jgi:hypothetical protein